MLIAYIFKNKKSKENKKQHWHVENNNEDFIEIAIRILVNKGIAVVIHFSRSAVFLCDCQGWSNLRNFTILWWFLHTSAWINHRYTCVPSILKPPPHLPSHSIPPGCHRALALGALCHTWNAHWLSVYHSS